MIYSIIININEGVPLIQLSFSSALTEDHYNKLVALFETIGYSVSYGTNLVAGGLDKSIVKILYSEISIHSDTKDLNHYEVAKKVETILKTLGCTILQWERKIVHRTLRSRKLEGVYP